MGYIVQANMLGMVIAIIDSDNPTNPQEEEIINNVEKNGYFQQGQNNYYDATPFITNEAEVQLVDPMDVNLSEFTTYLVDTSVDPADHEISQWLKNGSEPPVHPETEDHS